VKHNVLILLALAASLVVGSTASGQTEDGYRLSLGECLRVALEENLDLVSARIDPRITEEQVKGEQGAFDPTLQASLSTDETEQSPTNPFEPSSRANTDLRVSVIQQMSFGPDYRATLFVNENDAPGFNRITVGPITNPSVMELNPRLASGLDLELNVPLLKGRGRKATSEMLFLRRGDLEMSRQDLQRQAQTIMKTVEWAYWDTVAAREALRVAEKSLQRANDLLALNRKKVEVGTLAPIEITEAEAGVASNEEQVIISATTLGNAEDELRRLMAVPAADPIWEQTLVLTDRPAFEPQEIDVEAAIETALRDRPEMASAKEDLRKRELSERAARNRVKHGLDVQLRFRPSGDNDESYLREIAGVDTIIGVEGDVWDSLAEIGDVDNYFWSAGLTYTLPIRNRQAKSNLAIARLNHEKGQVNVQNQAQTIRVEVRAAAREVDSGIQRIAAARKNVELQEKRLDAEQKKFENGMSTSFLVLTAQTDLADAELRRINAALTYTKALTTLAQAKGALLEARGLTLAD